MSKKVYQVITVAKSTEEFKNVTVYGITLVINGCETGKIADISSEREFVEHIVNKLNSHDVSEVHFYDVVEDFTARQLPM